MTQRYGAFESCEMEDRQKTGEDKGNEANVSSMVRHEGRISESKGEEQDRACLSYHEMYFRFPQGLLQRDRKESQPFVYDILTGECGENGTG